MKWSGTASAWGKHSVSKDRITAFLPRDFYLCRFHALVPYLFANTHLIRYPLPSLHLCWSHLGYLGLHQIAQTEPMFFRMFLTINEITSLHCAEIQCPVAEVATWSKAGIWDRMGVIKIKYFLYVMKVAFLTSREKIYYTINNLGRQT